MLKKAKKERLLLKFRREQIQSDTLENELMIRNLKLFLKKGSGRLEIKEAEAGASV